MWVFHIGLAFIGTMKLLFFMVQNKKFTMMPLRSRHHYASRCYLCIILIIVRKNIPIMPFVLSPAVPQRRWYHVLLDTETNLISPSPAENLFLFIIVLTDYAEYVTFRCRHSHMPKCRPFCPYNVCNQAGRYIFRRAIFCVDKCCKTRRRV